MAKYILRGKSIMGTVDIVGFLVSMPSSSFRELSLLDKKKKSSLTTNTDKDCKLDQNTRFSIKPFPLNIHHISVT